MITGQPLKLVGDEYERAGLLRELEYLHKRLNEVFLKGEVVLERELTPAGTTGALTTSKIAGSVNFAAASSSLVVTNPLVNVNSLIFCVVLTNDATALLKSVVPGDGFFTIRLNAAATAETRVGFWLTN